MSWTSPLTVARMTVPLFARLALLHERRQVVDRRLHRLGRLQHLRHDQLVGVEEPPDLVHAGHQRAVDDVERPGLLQLQVEVGHEPVARPLDDVAREALVERVGAAIGRVRRQAAAPPRAARDAPAASPARAR